MKLRLDTMSLLGRWQRGIRPNLIEHTIMNGRVERFGKNYVRFMSKSVICVGEIMGLKLKIITIERRE